MTYNLGTRMLADFNSMMTTHGTTYTVTRITETVDTMGTVSATAEATFTIIGMLQDNSIKDRNLHDMGLTVAGDRRFYCKALAVNGSDVIKEGDIITDQVSVQWKVKSVTKQPYINDTEIYRSCIVKNITSEGSA